MLKRIELLEIAKPILFNTEMVRAILDGRKTVTRRVVKPQPYHDSIIKFSGGMEVAVDETATLFNSRAFRYTPKFLPYRIKTGKGDILYVRETWCEDARLPYDNFVYKANMPQQCNGSDCPPSVKCMICSHCENVDGMMKWKPSIHMPKEAARIFLKVTDVRCERLQNITVEQALKEGFNSAYEFNILWDKTISKKDIPLYNWQANPWVWVYEFEVIQVD